VLVLFVLNILLDGNLYGRNIHDKVVRQIITASQQCYETLTHYYCVLQHTKK